MSDVLPAWAAITNWLALHAPASHATLRPGATGADVQSVQDGLGAPLPADLVTLLLTCNGTVDASDVERDPDEYDPGLFLAQHHLLPLGAIVAVRGSGGSAHQFCSDWVPFAEFLNALAEALTQGTGPLTATATSGFHEGALVWGPLPGDATPWPAAHSENESPAQTAEHARVDHGAAPAGRGS
ncbi:hypothetical protein [Streptomyces sp. NPDC055681]